jgi:hypothetical protein
VCPFVCVCVYIYIYTHTHTHKHTYIHMLVYNTHFILPLCCSSRCVLYLNNKNNITLYVQLTVHRDKLRINNQQDASSIHNFILSLNSTCFGHLLQRPHNLHETYQLPRVQLITPDDGHSRCPKHVEFCDKLKFWILDASCWLFIQRITFQYNLYIPETHLHVSAFHTNQH